MAFQNCISSSLLATGYRNSAFVLSSARPMGSIISSLFRRNATTPSGNHLESSRSATVEKNEQDFLKLREQWWKPHGEFEILSRMNELRVPLITEKLCGGPSSSRNPNQTLEGFSIIDVGCGGGLLSEPLARLGAKVTGLDIVESNIEAASRHRDEDHELKTRLRYICGDIKDMNEQFDALVASEVVEHVDNLDEFISHCSRVVKPRGHLFFTTINRTLASLLIAKIGAEYIVNAVPRGLHDWRMFVTPEELQLKLTKNGCAVSEVKGMMYHMIGGYWSWINFDCINYAIHAVKIQPPLPTIPEDAYPYVMEQRHVEVKDKNE